MTRLFSELSESKIFKNEEILSFEYLPELLPHRENQIKQLADNLQPASKGRKPQNTFIFGSPGIGKTASVKYVFREFEEFSERVKTIYINCWDFKTAHALLSQMLVSLGAFVQRRGWSKDELIQKLIEVCKKTNKSLIVCLDEVDQLEQEALYDLLRINQHIKNMVGVVFVSNNAHIFANVEPRIRSSLAVDEIEFKSYSIEEMKKILEERMKYAFHSTDSGVVALVANHAIQNGGDVRVGLECLLKAGRIAEQDNSNKVKIDHIKQILSKVKEVKPKLIKESVNEDEKMILNVLGNSEFTSGELYRNYCEKVSNPVSERAFRKYIAHLARTKAIKVERKRNIHGYTRIISKV